MEKKSIPLSNLPVHTKAMIVDMHGGIHFQRKLHTLGIRKGQLITIVSKQPFHGPLTIKVCGCQMTLGRGMAHRILVEEQT